MSSSPPYTQDNVRLAELNAELGLRATEGLYEPEVDAAEWPERRDVYTKDDLKAFAVCVVVLCGMLCHVMSCCDSGDFPGGLCDVLILSIYYIHGVWFVNRRCAKPRRRRRPTPYAAAWYGAT